MDKDIQRTLQTTSSALRQRAKFFWDKNPQDLTQDDFSTIAKYLEGMADSLDEFYMGRKRRKFLLGGLAFLIYLGTFAVCLGLFYYQYNPFEDRYYIKLAKEILSDSASIDLYVQAIKLGVSLVASLLLFLVAVFASIILSGILGMIHSRLGSALVEAVLASVLVAALFYVYVGQVYNTGMLMKLL